MDGGQAAITGFAVQIAVAVLDSFSSDWIQLTIEPSSETDEFTKVDILWRFPNGEVEFTQVKQSKNAFGKGMIQQWAEEIQNTGPARVKRLVLVGSPSAGGIGITSKFRDVTVEIIPPPFAVLLDACAHRVRKYLEETGFVTTSTQCEEITKFLIGRLLLDAKDGRVWDRMQLESAIWRPFAAPLIPSSDRIVKIGLGRLVVFTPDIDERGLREINLDRQDVIQFKLHDTKPGALYITGRAPGVCNLTYTFSDGSVSVYELRVAPDFDCLRSIIREVMPTANVSIIPGLGNLIIVKGIVQSAEDADCLYRLAQVQVGGHQNNVVFQVKIKR